MKFVMILALALVAGCAALEDTWQRATGTSVVRTFERPVAQVKPAFVSTLAQRGMPIASMLTRGGNEVVKAGRSERSVDVEFERLGASSTRVRVTGSGEVPGQIMREAEKRLARG